MRRFRGYMPASVRTLRLCSGFVLFTYVTLHLLNHALGNVSLAWMERGLLVQKFVWQGALGTVLLYASLSVHFVLGLWALYERRRLYWTGGEFVQLLLGLAVPPLLANHLAATRIAFATFDLNKGYAQELYSFWIASPFLGKAQLALLVVAWVHGCMGFYFWLRLRPWFERVRSVLLAASVLVPVLALLGYFQAGRSVVALAQDPAWRAATTAASLVGTPAQNAWLANLRNGFLLFDGVALGLIILARLARALYERRKGRIRISYPNGRRVAVPLGFSVLEASRIGAIPHADPCGGRGRCSLCRVQLLGEPDLAPPEEAERRVLSRLGVDPRAVRLACQLRPERDVSVIPIVPPAAQLAFLHRRQGLMPPQEKFLVHMFIDMRDSTHFAAQRLPHDSVFVLGRFIAGVSSAVLDAGGTPNQFLGDGILALFGLQTDARTAARQALSALGIVARNIRQLATLLHDEIGDELRFGIGMQCGPTIVGEIGFRDYVTFTSLGDPPNVASRLQTLSRELGCEAVVGEEVLEAAGMSGAALPTYGARVRGRDTGVAVRLFYDIERDLQRLSGG